MKLLSWILLPPLTLATLYLAIANRHLVLFSLDPFNAETPALALEVPLFAIVLFCVFLGILFGGASSWIRGGRGRTKARQTRREVQKLSKEVTKKSKTLPVPASRTPDPTE